MSEPKRYTDLQVWEALHFAGSTNGWIRWEDYSRLKAEVERLIEERCFLNEKLNHFVKQTVQNREQVERLRKAGDAMAEAFNLKYPVAGGLINAWNAAKEGKQP